MNFIEFLFAIIAKFAPISDTRIAQLKAEGTEWYDKTVLSKTSDDKPAHPIVQNLKEHGEKWYVKTALAVGFIFAVRWVADFMNPAVDDSRDNF